MIKAANTLGLLGGLFGDDPSAQKIFPQKLEEGVSHTFEHDSNWGTSSGSEFEIELWSHGE